MNYHATFKCDEHSNIFDCPDNIIIYDKNDDSYGIAIHDGGCSFIQIDYCPWCGKNLIKNEAPVLLLWQYKHFLRAAKPPAQFHIKPHIPNGLRDSLLHAVASHPTAMGCSKLPSL